MLRAMQLDDEACDVSEGSLRALLGTPVILSEILWFCLGGAEESASEIFALDAAQLSTEKLVVIKKRPATPR